MARFVRHEKCPQCGSRDNLGRYDDGSAWCFGCHYRERSSGDTFIPAELSNSSSVDELGRLQLVVDQCTYTLPEKCLDYGRRFGLTSVDFLKAEAKWHPRTESLIFLYYDKGKALCCIQGRSFSDQPKTRKYHNWGSTYNVIDINGTRGSTLVITEDKLSAIKVSGVCDAFPALGTTFQLHKIVTVKQLGYQRVVVWLDHDKWRESREIMDQCKWLGLSASSVLTEDDPKCYSHKQIEEYLI